MSNQKFKHFFKKFVFIVGCLYSVVYVLSSLTPYLSAKTWFAFTFFGLLFPVFFTAMLFWLLIVVFFYRKYFLFFLILLFVGYKNIFSVFACNFSSSFTVEKKPDDFRVLSWNVSDFIDDQIANDTPYSKRREIFSFIKQMQPDIVCIQDFAEKDYKFFKNNIQDVIQAGNFSYHIFNIDFASALYPFQQYGTAIFSKFPIVDSGKIAYNNKKNSESLFFVDVKKDEKIIRIFNTHLQSMFLKFQAEDVDGGDNFIKEELPFLKQNKRYRERIIHYDKVHVDQANLIRQVLDTCKYPFVFCADLNSVPSSYTYQTISKNLTDGFIKKGFGFGGTYDGFSPTIRIDVVLMNKQLKPTQYYSPHLKISDHFPVVVDIKLK